MLRRELPLPAEGLPGHVPARHGPIGPRATNVERAIARQDGDADDLADEPPHGVARPVKSARSGPRRHVVLALDAVTPTGPIDVDGFHELRRLGLFDDCGRNPPPSWWAR